MEPSPLVQVSQPAFQPKIIRLYETLFTDDDDDDDNADAELGEGFWREFFLHRPDARGLKRVLASVPPDEMLHRQANSQQLVRRAVERVQQGIPPADEAALETLTVFLTAALAKKYTNPSSDVISLLAGLHDADAVMTDFIATLDSAIRTGRDINLRRKAVRATLAITAAGFRTALPSYFTHRDLFPALVRFIQDADDPNDIRPALYLLGLLANYNKFEFQNPYRLRLDDFVNEAVIRDIITCFAATCQDVRDAYIAVQDDVPEPWSLGSTLRTIGLGVLAPGSRPTTPTPTADESKSLFAALPGPEIGLSLAVYDFVNANKVFCFHFASLPAPASGAPSPLSAYLSMTSYLLQHAHRSSRSAMYTYVCLLILQVLVEDKDIVKRLCSDESKLSVRLCRQRPPFLPQVAGERTPAAVVLDLVVDGINHNLRRRLDVDFYILSLGILLRMLSYLSRTKTRIAYHWAELWRTLLSFLRFLTQYESDMKSNYKSPKMIDVLTNVLAFALSSGENFLPDPASYDDLFYKLVETGDFLTKFRDTFALASSPAIQILINVSSHYHSLLADGKKGKHFSPDEVSVVIKQGYETLSIDSSDGLDAWDKYREADHKPLLKKIARAVVDDAKVLNEE